MTLAIQLLGPPRVERDGSTVPRPRGRKAWALLAFLVQAESPVARARLAELLFDDADDPLGALRWNLAELRRLLGAEATIGGDPVTLELSPGSEVDVRILTTGTWMEASRVPGIGLEFLAGADSTASAAFEAWLLTERRRLAHLSAAVLREAASAHLAAGRAEDALDAATKLVGLDEFDEDGQILLVEAHRAAGGPRTARTYLEATVARFRRELGVDPGPALLAAADRPAVTPPATIALQGPAAVESLLAAGEAAIAAGVLDAGFDILSRAAASARELTDAHLEARVQASLGTALIHGGRGLDAPGTAALHAAIRLAEQAGDAELIATSARELGYADMKRGRYERAEVWLARAVAVAPNETGRASAMAVRGVVASDRGRTAQGLDWLASAAELARREDRPRQEAWALTFLARTHVLRQETEPARDALTRAIEVARSTGWITLLSLPLSLLADVDALEGRAASAMEGYQAAFALGCQVSDPCWEGMAARGIGMAHAAAGRIDEAVRWLDDARTRCMRVADAYLWVHAHCLDALCTVAAAHGVRGADDWISDLEGVSARTGMQELLARAWLHRVAIGQPGALESAALFADRIDNPVVLDLVRQARTVAVA